MFFVRIAGLVVQLLAWCLDEEVFAGAHCVHRTEPERLSWVQGFGIGGTVSVGGRRIAWSRFHDGDKRLALHRLGNRHPHGLQDGRSRVDQGRSGFDLFSRRTIPRQLDDQRHADGRIVKENPMRCFAMVSQRLAVIRHH